MATGTNSPYKFRIPPPAPLNLPFTRLLYCTRIISSLHLAATWRSDAEGPGPQVYRHSPSTLSDGLRFAAKSEVGGGISWQQGCYHLYMKILTACGHRWPLCAGHAACYCSRLGTATSPKDLKEPQKPALLMKHSYPVLKMSVVGRTDVHRGNIDQATDDLITESSSFEQTPKPSCSQHAANSKKQPLLQNARSGLSSS